MSWAVLNVENDVEEEIKIRTTQGKGSLVSRSTKIRLSKTIVGPILMYGCESRPLTIKYKIILSFFKRIILRSIRGPLHENGVCRIRTNRELTDIFGKETIIGTFRAARLRWEDHVIRMSENSRERFRRYQRGRKSPKMKGVEGKPRIVFNTSATDN